VLLLPRAAHSSAAVARSLPHAWAVSACRSPLRRLGQAQLLAQQARASTLPCFLLLSRWHRDPICQGTFFLLTSRANFFPSLSPIGIWVQILPFPFLESPSGYKNKLVHPSAPSHLDAKHRSHPEGAPLE
jgi:hypothetical protein